MIIERENEILATVVATPYRNKKTRKVEKMDLYVPDFGITIHGVVFMEAFIQAELILQAIYESYTSRGIQVKTIMSYDEAQELCNKPGMFASYVRARYSGGGLDESSIEN